MSLQDERQWRIGILVFNGVEVLAFTGPYEVFTTASRELSIMTGRVSDMFVVSLVSTAELTIKTRPGMQVIADVTIDKAPELDLLIIPGGVLDEPISDQRLLAWLRELSNTQTILASVCSGAFLLAEAGLLDNLNVTTHWDEIDNLRQNYSQLNVIEKKKWIDQEQILTSAGISAGIDMSLHLIERLTDDENENLAGHTTRRLEYDWQGELNS